MAEIKVTDKDNYGAARVISMMNFVKFLQTPIDALAGGMLDYFNGVLTKSKQKENEVRNAFTRFSAEHN